MANIKFSQFTVGNTESDIDFVVGYKGANNIQISPANLLSATLTGYLPLTGGTMTGNIFFIDNVQAQFGTGNDLRLVHDGTDSFINSNGSGDLYIQQFNDDKNIIFKSDDGSGGVTTYFELDGNNVLNKFRQNLYLLDNVGLKIGNSFDLDIKHDGSDSYIQNSTGDLYIRNFSDNKDVIFQSDDGSGGITDYFRLDGGLATAGTVYTVFPDNSRATFGAGYDLQIYHDASNSYIKQGAGGHLIIQQETDDGDIAFKSDDGSGGIATYMTIDGGVEMTTFSKDTRHNDSVKGRFGSGGDLYIEHDGTDSKIINTNGDLSIQNQADDKDIIFKSDDGSGGVTTYFFLDGSSTQVKYDVNLKIHDNKKLIVGDGDDLQIYHDGTTSNISNNTGNLSIINHANNSDIKFFSDDGSGGVTEYFRLDGGDVRTIVLRQFRFLDNVALKIGTSGDLSLSHDATNTRIENFTGALKIINNTDDGNIEFFCDNGSGGITEYFKLDGTSSRVQFSKNQWLTDNVKILLGNNDDLQIYHGGTNSVIDNITGNLIVTNFQDDGDITFLSDNGSGGTTEYFRLDGSTEQNVVSKNMRFEDSVQAQFGAGTDLRIHHDGNNSFIDDSGTGDLRIRSNFVTIEKYNNGEIMASFNDDNAVSLYFNNSKKFETTSTGIRITGISEYADNTAAIAGGLTTGDVYRTGDLLKIVH